MQMSDAKIEIFRSISLKGGKWDMKKNKALDKIWI